MEKLQKHGAQSAKMTFFASVRNMEYMEAQANIGVGGRLPRGCRLINLPEHRDKRGCLSIAEWGKGVPFAIERVFWIYDVPEGAERGAHSHNECAEVVVPVNGAFDMTLDDGTTQTTVHLDSPHTGILIPAGVWCRLSGFAPGTVCVVLASHPFNAAGYVHDYATYKKEAIEVVPYRNDMADTWNTFVATSKNGTFLFHRDYMDYHADRFVDCSLLFYKKGELVAVLPANYKEEERTVYSHGGLTYGGLLLSERTTVADTIQVMACAIEWMKLTLGAKEWIYKPVPHIYHRAPAEEDLYALFRQEATLVARGVSSAITNDNALPMQELRRRGVKKAAACNVVYEESDALHDFWLILEEVLAGKHGCKPVHTLEEMERLKYTFPNNIRLFVAKADGNVVAGTLIYETEQVAHAQYIATSAEGRSMGALDGLFCHLITEVFSEKRFFDFGISTEQGGRYLNEGLAFQKEGFGARAVVYDTYKLKFED